MNRYKVEAGENTKRSKKSYKDFLKLIHENNSELMGNYYGMKINTDFNIYGFTINTYPEHAKQIIKTINKVKDKIAKEGDRFIRLVDYTKYGFLYEIDIQNNYTIKLFYPNYSQFCRSRDMLNKAIYKNNHTLLSVYKGKRTKVLIDFKCGHPPYWIDPISYRRSGKCPMCSDKCSWYSKQKFEKLILKNNHILLTEYIKGHNKVLVDFKCGHEPHWITPRNYTNGYGCPKCATSKGVKIICEYLEENNIDYFLEFKIENRFYDIYISSYNLLVEVHGSQHYEENKFFKMPLKEQQRIDLYKKNMALRIGYKYIEVDYREHIPSLALQRFKEQFKQLNGGTPIVDATKK